MTTAAPHQRWIYVALFWTIAAFGVVTIAALAAAPHFILPEEDAVILFQYSRNLAQTGAITYIPHGPHAEGATDFLWMILLACGMKLHVTPFWSVAVFNLTSLLCLPWLLARIAGERLRWPFALFAIGAFGLMPQASAAALGFSVLPFACLLTITVLFFLKRNDAALGLSSLVLCLFRPDGIVFALPLMTSALLVRRERVRRMLIFVATFVAPGLAYFGWRQQYFGEWLPLPFLVKSDTYRIFGMVVAASLEHGVFLCVFAGALLWLALRGLKVSVDTRILLICVVVLPNLFYFAMRLDQNAGHRFFVYLPLGMALVVASAWSQVRERRRELLCAGAALWFLFVGRMSWNAVEAGREAQFDNRVAIAQEMATLAHGVLLTTEAGFVPYGSGWNAYDAWGLNTESFAKRLLQPVDVTALQPDAVLLYAGGTRECAHDAAWPTPYTTRTWQHMTRNLIAGLDPAHYERWYAPYASMRLRRAHGIHDWDGDQECWFVRRDAVQRLGLEKDLRDHGGEPEAEYLSHQPAKTSQPESEHPSRLRVFARTPYRWWKRLSD